MMRIWLNGNMNFEVGDVVAFRKDIYLKRSENFFEVIKKLYDDKYEIRALDGRIVYTDQSGSSLRSASPLEVLALEAE